MSMAKAKEAQEPSMEEILASIRRIISDESQPDEAAPAAAEAAPVNEEDLDRLFSQSDDTDPDAEVLVLTDDMTDADDDNGGPELVEATPDVAFVEPTRPARSFQPSEPEPRMAELPRMPPRSPERAEPIMSKATDASISAAFGSLSHVVLTANARTLDDLVADMLRPMLRDWLDSNLPPLVERLVRQEIERVARGR
jgi:cell pole-organizing protein PopZ